MSISLPIVVLGARIVGESRGPALEGAIGRRAREGARLYAEVGAPLVVASGGCAWGGVVEADAIQEMLVALGVPRAIITRDRCSLSTRDNARYGARALEKRGYREAFIVTCAWHVERAVRLFRREGVVAHAHPVDEPPAPLRTRVWRWGHERVAMRLAGVT
jgi:uncharacterized SAM-binding protein YcdF (DUF218 family)